MGQAPMEALEARLGDAIAIAVRRAFAERGRSLDVDLRDHAPRPLRSEVVQPISVPVWRRSDDDDAVDLTAPEHAWWVGSPAAPDEHATAPARTDEHVPAPEPPLGAAPPDDLAVEPTRGADAPADAVRPAATTTAAAAIRAGGAGDDPYAVLRVAPDATWDEISSAYKRLARWYHPDGMEQASPEERAASEDMIRRINAAYGELRVRRAR